MSFWIGFGLGLIIGPVAVVVALFLLRDVTPPILFVPSDWDRCGDRTPRGGNMTKGSHAYLGINTTGQARAICMDDPGYEKQTAETIADWIKMGRIIEWLPIAEACARLKRDWPSPEESKAERLPMITPRKILQLNCRHWLCRYLFGPSELESRPCPYSDGNVRMRLYCTKCGRGIEDQ
jgi:hypothetical protein